MVIFTYNLKPINMNLKQVSPTVLRSRLKNEVIQFAFKKVDGSLRTAVGTTNLSTIPVESHPTGKREASEKQVNFFDLEKKEWRSVSSSREIYIWWAF